MKELFEATRRITEAAGIRFHTNELGEGPTLLCFHGGGPGANSWDNSKRSLENLARTFRVILLDLPGHGRTDARGSELLEAGESRDRFYARAIAAFLDARGIDRVHLYGPSQGSEGALGFGLMFPERVGRVIVKCPPLGLPYAGSPRMPAGIVALRRLAQHRTRENTAALMREFVPLADILTEEMIDDRHEIVLSETEFAVPMRPSQSLLAEVRDFKPTTLILWGREDRAVPPDNAGMIVAAFPDARLHIWGGTTGHFVEWEQREEWERLITDFLEPTVR